jgi:hypothetical protein
MILENSIEVEIGKNEYIINSSVFENIGNYYIIGNLFYRNYFYKTKSFSIMRATIGEGNN